ncbi:Eukaryotic translation initiation factor 2-alpha kinase 1 [Eumeta japonica]|uniref:non-specific serine/threonine protein kinase n=1 Tax=Eumeta variegata TaxID=151549 RepID=A0A4C1W657_EUMVA|nr:Eukaryotic translation initiation factor 2-alpha kinase 1 [Eumeta japonica]
MDQLDQNKWEALATVKSFDLGVIPHNHHESDLHQSAHQIDCINSSVTTTPISILVQSLVQQLCTLLEKDENRADQLYKTICEKLHSMNLIDDSYAMGEFEMMRSQYQWALVQLVAVANGSQPLPISLPSTWPKIQPSGLQWSRYHKDFEELYFIAGGGFGKVYVARHKLDGMKYAVKKVNIHSTSVDHIMNHLAEVKTLASLNHPNIVNYKAAWLEPMIETVKKKRIPEMKMDSDEFTNFGSNLRSSVFPNIMSSFKTHNSKELIKSHSQSDFEISFRNSNSPRTENESDEESNSYETEEDTPSLLHENVVCKWPSPQYENRSCVNLKWATLYIQMSLCHQTLKEWLEDRNRRLSAMRKNSIDLELHHSFSNSSSPLGSPVLTDPQSGYPPSWNYVDVSLDIFTQLVRGLHYIHSRGIIHHDIKPSNVFVAREDNGLLVLLGDFGLACPLQRTHTGLGTHLYAAPEQLEGHCDPKSDMYSLGIVLLEMVEIFVTDMERVKTIEDLRKGQIPAHLTVSHPKIAHIISKLVQRRPSKRYESAQLLEELEHLRENKDEIIKSLKEELAAKDDEIMKLKLMIAKLHH